ncbi:MAG: signal peptidase I [Candidatus Zixiibacteriota bacterium]
MSDTKNIIWENIKAILWAGLFALIIKTSVAETYKVPTGSMEDTILAGDFLIANKFIFGAQIPLTNYHLPAIRDIRQGDVIVFRFPLAPDTSYVKRCVALPGQVVEVKDKELFVDGIRFPDPPHSRFTANTIPRPSSGENSRDNWGPYRVPPDHYFMMGDNRDNSYDSRYWGPVQRDLIQGSAMIIHWSWEDDPNEPEVTITDPLSPPKLFLYNAVHFFERVRWSRLLNIIN